MLTPLTDRQWAHARRQQRVIETMFGPIRLLVIPTDVVRAYGVNAATLYGHLDALTRRRQEVYKTNAELRQETGLTPGQLRRARAILVEAEGIQVRREPGDTRGVQYRVRHPTGEGVTP